MEVVNHQYVAELLAISPLAKYLAVVYDDLEMDHILDELNVLPIYGECVWFIESHNADGFNIFSWENTPQGYEFWSRLETDLQHRIRKALNEGLIAHV